LNIFQQVQVLTHLHGQLATIQALPASTVIQTSQAHQVLGGQPPRQLEIMVLLNM
jgi:hypothetical protein